jgi:hypothetical protein
MALRTLILEEPRDSSDSDKDELQHQNRIIFDILQKIIKSIVIQNEAIWRMRIIRGEGEILSSTIYREIDTLDRFAN